MPRLSMLLVAAPLALLAAVPMPASAQEAASSDRVNMVIIYGDDPCPPSAGNEITVCARKDEGERYRIPAPFRGTSPSPENESWNSKVLAYERVGAFGAQSCSPVGSAGWTGCEAQMIHNAAVERKNSSDVQFGKMIEAARAKRLSTIDADAANTQANVEAAEKDYDARQQASHDAAASAATAPKP